MFYNPFMKTVFPFVGAPYSLYFNAVVWFGSLCFTLGNFRNGVAFVIIHFKIPCFSHRNQMPVSDFQGLGGFIHSWP